MAESNKLTSIGGTTFVNLAGVLGLVALGWFIIRQYQKFQEFRHAPILVGGLTSPEEAKSSITIAIPELFIPRTQGETQESVLDRYKPKLHMEGLELVADFNPIKTTVIGVDVTYTPDPVRMKLTRALSATEQLAIAVKLTPTVMPSSDPDGWLIRFPVVTFLA